MTIYELAIRRVQQCGMEAAEAESMLESFSRTERGREIGWGDIAPQLNLKQIALIDGAAVGYRMRKGAMA